MKQLLQDCGTECVFSLKMNKKSVYIEIDRRSGFCFGVVNAIACAEESMADGGQVYSLGDIVHNYPEVQRLERLGLSTIHHEDMEGIAGKTVLIRAHGEPPSTYRRAENNGIRIIDATCPVVSKLQKQVAEAYRDMTAVGGQVVILGKKGHAEVVGLTGQTDGNAIVVENESDLEQVDSSRPVYFLSQTTQSLALFRHMAGMLKERAVDEGRVIVRDTVCRQVANREEHLREFSERFDVIVFVSGRKSSNGKVLFEVCHAANPKSYHIESAAELDPAWFAECCSVGICGATSTPQWLMEEVAVRVASITE